MTVDEAVRLLWEAWQQQRPAPEELRGQLTLDTAYRVQLGLLARHLAAGEQQAGWKIGLTAEAVRRLYGSSEPVFGYLLQSRCFRSGHAFAHAAIPHPALEAELCFTLGRSLRGPGVTPAQVLDAVASVAPALEIVSLRGSLAADLPLGVAENVSQWAYVVAPAQAPYPRDLDLDAVAVEVRRNGKTVLRARGAEALDNPLHALAWLANRLAAYGRALEAGQCVLTGSFIKPQPVAPGEHWEAHFTPLGSVAATFTATPS
ncbi:MAG: 2-hydroxypenta-2,4-dienoate hydratase [Candidatus Tectimicrobiota bacterium]|nr:MAG: 2-hydroxypenta-2,4-dienoate hydratase [Candidatus Tectomicrobia bacterium]